MLKLSNFNYNLPPELIAQEPASPRDSSRLLVLDKATGKIEHKHFYDIIDYLKPSDVLVLNNTKVFPARLIGQKSTGGKIEIFLLKKIKKNLWQCLIKGGIKSENNIVVFSKNLRAEVVKKNEDATYEVKFNKSGQEFMRVVKSIGLMPLPPYIKTVPSAKYPVPSIKNKISHSESYQTVFANDKKLGSVAAPTAGLHFTPALLKKIKNLGVEIIEVTLHVGLGTFAPIKTENILEHKMHSELMEIKKSASQKILTAKKAGRRIIAVGTTSCRTLETLGQLVTANPNIIKHDILTSTNIFIYPPYQFKMVDALITNFHLPKSTLLLLVSALAGKKNIGQAYQTAIAQKYRFFSYGDAMLIK